MVDDSKCHCPDTTRVIGTVPTGPTLLKLDDVPALRRGTGHKASPITKELFVADSYQEKENPFSLGGVALGLSTTHQGRTHVQE